MYAEFEVEDKIFPNAGADNDHVYSAPVYNGSGNE